MSLFYQEISKYYSDIFPYQKEKFEMMAKLLKGDSQDLLDLASGDGLYIAKLAEEGHRCTALDLSERMLKMLEERTPKVQTICGNMLDLDKLTTAKFDAIYCLGNSLVHLESEAEVFELLRQCRKHLKPKGQVLVQIINYDRILDQNLPGLGTIRHDDKGLIFERYYERVEDARHLNFRTVLEINGQRYENHQRLLALRTEPLLKALRDNGFENIECFGSYQGTAYDIHSSVQFLVLAS